MSKTNATQATVRVQIKPGESLKDVEGCYMRPGGPKIYLVATTSGLVQAHEGDWVLRRGEDGPIVGVEPGTFADRLRNYRASYAVFRREKAKWLEQKAAAAKGFSGMTSPNNPNRRVTPGEIAQEVQRWVRKNPRPPAPSKGPYLAVSEELFRVMARTPGAELEAALREWTLRKVEIVAALQEPFDEDVEEKEDG